MQFIVKAINNQNIGVATDAKYFPNILADLFNAGLKNIPNGNWVDVKDVQQQFEEIVKHIGPKTGENLSFQVHTSIANHPVNLILNGHFKDDKFVVTACEFDEKTFTSPFTYKDIPQKKQPGLAANIIKNYIEHANNPQRALMVVDKPTPKKVQVPSRTWTQYAKDKLVQILPHAFIAAGTYALRNPIIAGLTAIASRVGLMAISAFITPITVVATAVGLSAAFVAARDWFKRSKAASYESKTVDELNALSFGQVQAFLDGVKAQQSYTAQAKTCFSFNDYRHGNAYFAGMGAAAGNKDELIKNIENRTLSSVSDFSAIERLQLNANSRIKFNA